jgi:hypothetical protein
MDFCILISTYTLFRNKSLFFFFKLLTKCSSVAILWLNPLQFSVFKLGSYLSQDILVICRYIRTSDTILRIPKKTFALYHRSKHTTRKRQ